MARIYIPSHVERLINEDKGGSLKGLESDSSLSVKVSKSRKSIVVYMKDSLLGTIYAYQRGKFVRMGVFFKPSPSLLKLMEQDRLLRTVVQLICDYLIQLYWKGYGVPRGIWGS